MLTQVTAGELGVDDRTDVAPVDTHSECHGRNHDVKLLTGDSDWMSRRRRFFAGLSTLRRSMLTTAFPTASGGLSSYALVLMASSLLQQPASAGVSVTSGVGPLLVEFLERFSALPEPQDALHVVVVGAGSRLLAPAHAPGRAADSV